MKQAFNYIIFALFILGINPGILAQMPQKMSYQAVVRDNNGKLVANSTVGLKFSIIQKTVKGGHVFEETQITNSNANGLITLEIGTGQILSGSIDAIEWGNGPYFIKTEIDPSGGYNYSTTSINQIMSVPYALYSKTAEKLSDINPVINTLLDNYPYLGITAADTARWNTSKKQLAETDPTFTAWNRSSGISITTSQISDFASGAFEKELAKDETKVDLSFMLTGRSVVYLNGNVLPSPQWSGIDSKILKLNIKIELFDKLKVIEK